MTVSRVERCSCAQRGGSKRPHGAEPMAGERGALAGAARDAVRCAAGAGQCALLPPITPQNPTVAAEATPSL